MRIIVKQLFSAASLSIRRNVVRYSSTDTKSKEKEQKVVEPVKKNIIIEKYGAITTINIDRRSTRNSLDVPTLKEMATAIAEFNKDKEAKVLVFSGEGGTFCSGFDIDEIEKVGYSTMTDAAAPLLKRPLCDKVTIAAVAGYAVAEGFELANSCDLRVIEDTAVMGCLGRRFGVPQSIFGARKLTALIGLSRALDLLITGRLITGTEANQFGLACKLTSTGTALGESVKLAKSLVKFPQSAMIMDKLAAVNSQLNPNSEESMRDEAVQTSLRGYAIEDIAQGIKKFQSGIGKHGKFYKLTNVPLEDWELEDTEQQSTIPTNPPTPSDQNKPSKAEVKKNELKQDPKT